MRAVVFLMVISTAVGFRYNYVDPRIYSFGFTGVRPGAFFDGEKLTGPHVELMEEICCRAAKRCAAALVPFTSCWDGQLSPVLDNRWHDVCVLLGATPRRKATFEFSDINMINLGTFTLITGVDSNITIEDLENPRNDIKLIVQSDPSRFPYTGPAIFLQRFFVKPENIIFIDLENPSEANDEITRLVNDPCETGGLAVGFVATALIDPDLSFKVVTPLGKDIGGATIMVRKDEQGILDWWDYTLKRFMCSPEYAEFCKRMDQQFGPNEGNCPDPSQVDCSDCTRPHRVPGCDCPAE